jgi:hypothetical protein
MINTASDATVCGNGQQAGFPAPDELEPATNQAPHALGRASAFDTFLWDPLLYPALFT